MKHIVSWSGGKDSTATIILAHEHGLPIDLIVISLLWFDKKRKIYGEYPEHVKWIFEYAIPLFESWGYPVKVITSDHDYLYWFYHVITKSKRPERNGKLSGFLMGGRCYRTAKRSSRYEHIYKVLTLNTKSTSESRSTNRNDCAGLTKSPANLRFWNGMATRKLWPVRNAKNAAYFPRRTKYSNVAAAGSVRIKILKVLHI